MNLYDNLNNKNFLLYCAHYYDNPQCVDTKEFLEDVNKIKYIKKLLTRYEKTGDLKEHLILNHMIILNNVFPAPHLARILALKIYNHLKFIKPFMIKLNVWPSVISNIGPNKENIITDLIPMDLKIIEALRKI